MFYQSLCKTCGGGLIFAWTEKGKRIPLDAEPLHFVPSTYNVGELAYKVIDGQALPVRGMTVSSARPDSVVAHRPHLATCMR